VRADVAQWQQMELLIKGVVARERKRTSSSAVMRNTCAPGWDVVVLQQILLTNGEATTNALLMG